MKIGTCVGLDIVAVYPMEVMQARRDRIVASEK